MLPFQYTSYAQQVIFAPGSLTRLSEALEPFNCSRLLLCTGRSMQANGHVTALQTALGDRLVAVCDHVLPHVQDVQVNELLALALEKNVDGLIGMGGGSPIGMAKALSYALERQRPGRPAPVIAIPGTYAGSEMTAVVGVTHTDETPHRKVTLSDPGIAPKLVLYDPELTLDLPAEITASTGINALAHCIEALYSKTRNPLSSAAATAAVRHISNALPLCYRIATDSSIPPAEALDARSEMLLGAHLAGLALSSVSMGLHHGLCHVLGGSAGVPHGIANAIVLPHAIRFNAQLTAPELIPAVEAMGLPAGSGHPVQLAQQLAARISALIGSMNLPQRLRDAPGSLHESDLPELARLAFQNHTVQNNPTPITDVSQLEGLLKAAW